ncbi:NfeD family protein [Hydrogenophaga sp.]|uniref:NfeD family protein n=1 Tax=Hydrogenophaga sp. TaxID=1904254 RepID=UPI0019C7714E|nr:NfeD family protein [Hydrogenophaga sp.]MBD3893592.1 NfeD family protein [Hydrogenophaga sp.]
MSDSTIWWLLAGLAVTLELFTGTFYLLMLALGLVAAALAAHAGAGMVGQLVAAAAVGSTAVLAWYLVKNRRSAGTSERAQHSMHLDVGEQLHIETWQTDGSAQVKYRGAQWTAVLRPGETPAPGLYRVAELVGNRLLVQRVPAPNDPQHPPDTTVA